MYKWQVWYSKKKLKQDFRCNECIENIYHGIERVSGYAPLIPEKEEGNEGKSSNMSTGYQKSPHSSGD